VSARPEHEPLCAKRALGNRHDEGPGYPPGVAVAQPALVGRRQEIGVLERALAAVERGPARAIGLRGEPGIGKSRLLAELSSRAEERGHLVLAGRATELERDLPFALLIDTFDRYLASNPPRRLDDEHLAQLAAVLPAVGRMPGVEPAPSPDGRHLVARAVRALLELLAGPQPVTVLLDDVQWADPASNDVLALLLHRPPPTRVLLTLATRAGRAPDLEAALETSVRNGSAEVLDVGPLSRKAAEGLLPSLRRAARERLYVESGGNPFYLEALARAAGSDPHRGVATGMAGVPRAVRAALAGEVGVLPPHMREVLEGAAVAGDPFEPELAGAAIGIPEDAVLSALDELLATDLIRPTDEPRRFRFRHPLVRRAVYEGTAGGSRLAAHARAANALAARGATPAQRAHHAERAARPGDMDAVDLLAEAAQETATRAPITAAGWYGSALRLLPAGPEHDERRLELLRAQADAFIAANRAVDARDTLRRTLPLLPDGVWVARVEVIAALAHLEVWIGNPAEAHDLLTQARSALGDRAPREFALLTLELAHERYSCGDFGAVEGLVEEARAAAREAADAGLEAAAVVRAAGAAAEHLRGLNEAALAEAERLLDKAEGLVDALPDKHLAEQLDTLLWLATAELYSDRSAEPGAERGLRLARGTGQGFLATAFMSLLGYAAERSGRLDSASKAAEEAVESALVSGNATIMHWGAQLSAWVALAQGRASDALADAEVVVELGRAHPPSSGGWTLADARLASGDPSGALEALESSGWVDPRLPPSDRLRALEVVVRSHVALERTEEAAEWAARAPEEAAGRRTGIFGAITSLIESQVLVARGDLKKAARTALSGAAAAQEAGAPLWEGRCRTVAGEALAAAGQEDEARAELRRAADDLDARGAAGYRDAALRILRQLGERPRPARTAAAVVGDETGALAALTPREREVAALVAEGRTNRQIGAQLHLSEKTIEKHVSSAMGKLGVSSRTGIARLVEREGPSLN
jgi:DNA-binding CsgD family transcriptional regulator